MITEMQNAKPKHNGGVVAPKPHNARKAFGKWFGAAAVAIAIAAHPLAGAAQTQRIENEKPIAAVARCDQLLGEEKGYIYKNGLRIRFEKEEQMDKDALGLAVGFLAIFSAIAGAVAFQLRQDRAPYTRWDGTPYLK